MTALNQIGPHFTGGFSQAECDTYFGLLNALRPACINIVGAAQYPQALEFAKACVQSYPGMRVIFRHMIPGFGFPSEDTGRWTKVSAKDWWTYIGRQYINTGITVLLSNEDTMDNYLPYADWTAECMTRAGDEGVGVAYLRLPTHHPRPGKEQMFDRILTTAFKYRSLHTHSPNAYWTADNLDAFKHVYAVINYAKKLGITLDTTIGEFALLRDIRDAHHGWRSCNISGRVYALDMTIKARVHLPGIPVCAFAVGKWPPESDTFSLDSESLDTLKANLVPLKAPPVVTPPDEPPPVVIEPPKGTIMIDATDERFAPYSVVTATSARTNVRNLPRVAGSEVVMILDPGVAYHCDHIPPALLTESERQYAHDGEHHWNVARFGGQVCWLREDVAVFTPRELPPPPDTSPLDDEERRVYLLEQATMLNYHAQKLVDITAIIKSLLEVSITD